jgi:hypothetical protein
MEAGCSVQLPCNAEVIDAATIGIAVVRTPADGKRLIEFLCPRCTRLHESVVGANP